MISHSPPIFSHSPPVSFLSEYMSNHRHNYNDETSRASRYYRPQMITLASKAMVNNAAAAAVATQQQQHHQQQQQQQYQQYQQIQNQFRSCNANVRNDGRTGLSRVVSAPNFNFHLQPKSCLSRKSCLHKASLEDKTSSDNCKCGEQSRCRKKVIFADDEGQPLTEVRVMSEPSNVPPYWSIKFLEQITQGLVTPHPADQWTVDFQQPASDYLSFRQKIEKDYVSLENVIVKDEESIVMGTVKVKNIDFEKEVIVRVTWDDWKSQQDIFCTYNRAYGPATCAHVVFDTFSFKITLPPSSKRLEFCICFRTSSQEFWDNNDGKNYTISKRSPFYYNALSPYDKNKNNSTCQKQVISALSEALANNKETQINGNQQWNQEPSPYW